jgi:5-formyltetrahydrofolate cyclo-ligase
MIDKHQLRAAMIAARSSLSPSEREEKSRAACVRLSEHLIFRSATKIAVYSAFDAEADPGTLPADGKQLAFPRIVAGDLEFAYARPEELTARGSFGIREPGKELAAIDVAEIELFLVPGLAFTYEGARIGYGKGHYDRILSHVRQKNPAAKMIGFAYKMQCIDELPVDWNDVLLDGVVTENGLTFRGSVAL